MSHPSKALPHRVSRQSPDQEASAAALKAGLVPGLDRQIEKLAASPLSPGLYLVSTPIGNLADISLRALFTLSAADLAFCEDTRHSRKLLSAYGISRKLETYHDFSTERDRGKILDALRAEKSVALISDAGTPLVSDPGFKLVRAAIECGFEVFAVPGASALLAGLVVAGLPTDEFHFGGFLPAKPGARQTALEAVCSVPGTLIFYESGGRLADALRVIAAILPGRMVAIARELTKLHETVLRGTAAELQELIQRDPPQGEFVVLIGPGEKSAASAEDIERALSAAMRNATLKEAVEEVTKGLGVGKKVVYNLALKMREGDKR
ncbi:MAG: 16S rRNA (cytidine(1402)-2'-O)-methyltransferase [Rhodomicrobium sp.]